MSDNSTRNAGFGNPTFPPPGSNFDPLAVAEPAKRGRRQKAAKAPKASRTPKAPKPERAPVRRAASANRTVGVLLAVVAMIMLAIVFTNKGHQTYVVRASTAIGSLQAFSTTDVSAFATSAANIQAGAITGTSANAALKLAKRELKGTYAQFPVAKNEQISTSLFSVDTAAPTASTLNPADRLMAVQADIGASAAGVRVGSYVDVVGVTTSVSPALAGVILSHVEVMAIAPPEASISSSAATANSKLPATSIGGTYVLLIPAKEETRVAAIAGSGSGTIYLTYESSQATTPAAATYSVIQSICGTNDPLHESGASTQSLPTGCQ